MNEGSGFHVDCGIYETRDVQRVLWHRIKIWIYWCMTRHLHLVTRLGNRWLPGKRLCKNGSHVLRQEHSAFGG